MKPLNKTGTADGNQRVGDAGTGERIVVDPDNSPKRSADVPPEGLGNIYVPDGFVITRVAKLDDNGSS